MFRRLNFLLPNASLAQKMVHELTNKGVNDKHIHTYSEHNLPIGSLNPATKNQINDEARQIENTFWSGNLFLFFIFLIIFLAAFSSNEYTLALLSVGVMLVSFTAGYFFTHHIPHTHLSEFKHATSHNELLVMVDVADEKVSFIENLIRRHHPAAIAGGSSWTLRNIDI